MLSQSTRVTSSGLFFSAATGIISAFSIRVSRPLIPHATRRRLAHFKAFDANIDEEELAEARKWHGSFDWSTLPRGTTTFARASGPGGQHVNKTESKATTSWTVGELSSSLPKVLRRKLRESRNANVEENKEKLVQELRKIYAETVPGKTDPEKVKRHAEIEETFHKKRIVGKKFKSEKKKFRRSSFSE